MSNNQELIKEMDKLMDPSEWSPDDNDSNWIIEKGVKVMTTFKESIEYNIDNEFIKNIKRYNALRVEVKEYIPKKIESNLTRIYSIVDKKTNIYHIGSTRSTIIGSTKIMISMYLNGQIPNIISTTFHAPIQSLELVVKLEEITTTNDHKFIKELKDKYIEHYSNLEKVEQTEINKCNNMIYIYNSYVENNKENVIKKEVTLYSITNESNIHCVGWTNKRVSERTPIKILNDINNNYYYNCEKLYHDRYNGKVNDKKIKISKCKKIRETEVGIKLKADKNIMKYGITNTYNDDYYVYSQLVNTNPYKQIALQVQKETFINTFKYDYNYTNIYCIVYIMRNNTNKTYIGSYKRKETSTNDLLKDAILNLYDDAINKKQRFSKISKGLADIPFNLWTYEVLSTISYDEKEKDANVIVKNYIDEYNSKDGYNEKLTNTQRRVYKFRRKPKRNYKR